MIWGAPSDKAHRAGQTLTSVLPKMVLLLALLAMGLYLPAPVNALFRQVAAGLGGT
jgi:hypothetical protein